MNKPTRTILLDDADEEYKELNETVGQQIKEGKESRDSITSLNQSKT